MSSRRNSLVRQRPVSFGNPALGTYQGFVYTLEGYTGSPTTTSRPVVEDGIETRCLVAMVDVPPKQVPEGILNLARSHRSFIDHVRIVIAENDPQLHQQDQQPSTAIRFDTADKSNILESQSLTCDSSTTSIIAPSPNALAMESAASILAEEQEKQDAQHRLHLLEKHSKNISIPSPERTYVVLIELCSDEAANELVMDLHEQPYTSLDESETCSVYHVIALKGIAGVSLMSPFFAPLSSSQIIPSSASPNNNNDVISLSKSSTSDSGIFPNSLVKTVSEDYNCAVCLEHMDLDARLYTTGSRDNRVSILTTVCNHSFHLDCLLQWQDSPCPVCRYDHSGLNETLSQCHVCGTTRHNYVCLICGVVSCCDGDSVCNNSNTIHASSTSATMALSRTTAEAIAARRTIPCVAECRSEDSTMDVSIAESSSSLVQHNHHHRIMASSHARAHYDETLHAYALNTETQHVWDFAGQGYVHRLLQNKDDGKIVEINDPRNTTSHERSLSPGLTEAQEGEVVHRKLEGFASQYYTLLKSQLEQQRIFYEGRLEEIRREYSDSRKERVSTTDLISALKQERHQLSQRLHGVETKGRKVEENVGFIKSLNESLETNRIALRTQIEHAQAERTDTRKMFEACLPPLQEKVTRLMLELEMTTGSQQQLDYVDSYEKPAAH